MKTYVAGSVCAALLGLASLAQAAQLISPPYALKPRGSGGTGTKAACVIRNSGAVPVTVNVSLVTNFDAIGIFDFCKESGKPRTLAGGETCLVSAELSEGEQGLTADAGSLGSYVACKVTAPNVTNLRGTLELAESPSHGFDVYLAVDF